MPMTTLTVLIKRLRVLIISRLLIGACLLFYAQFIFPVKAVVFYSIIALISFLSVLYVSWLITGINLNKLAWIQIGCDLILESLLIYYTGGVDSLFASIYILSILSAGLILSPTSSFYMASGSAICFITTVILVHHRWFPSFKILFPKPVFTMERESIYLFYASYVQVTVFFLVAILTYYFSRMIQRLEQKMKSQERLVFLGEVVSNIAHEIRNPLASISAAVELISKQLSDQLNDKQRKLMSAIVDESLRINRIFSGILNFARTTQIQPEEIVLERFFDEIFLLLQHHDVFKSNIKIKLLYKGKNIKIKADPEQIKEACMNVITNAYEAMEKEGTLTVDCEKNHNYVTISISDSGDGLHPKIMNELFIPFATTKINGTGLGLAQANKIVGQHGGRIEVDSKQGKGTRVQIILPVQI